jgi:RNA-directed DNA polymerase
LYHAYHKKLMKHASSITEMSQEDLLLKDGGGAFTFFPRIWAAGTRRDPSEVTESRTRCASRGYHRHQVSKQTFTKVDQAIFWALWQWARRRHPNKPKKWVREKYFQSLNDRNWVFTGYITDTEGSVQQRWLFSSAYMPIKRHTKIKAEANPYDPAWEMYFEERLGVKMANTLLGRRKILSLWKQQDGFCPVCQQKITKATGWTNHHIVGKVKGGKDSVENGVLLHPNCHQQVHSQRVEVVKPRPVRGVRKA